MKTLSRSTIAILALTVALLLSIAGKSALAADEYAVPWWTADAGGGHSEGGQYAVTGTIGQPDAGTMSAGPYTLHGGFWYAPASSTQPPEPPKPPEPPEPAEYQIYLPLIVQ